MEDLKAKFLLLRDTIPTETVDVPGVGAVTVRGLTAAGRDEWEQRIWNAKGRTLSNVRASLVAMCVYQDGKPLFTSDDVKDIGDMPATLIDHLYDVAMRLSGMGGKDKDTIEGNSVAAR